MKVKATVFLGYLASFAFVFFLSILQYAQKHHKFEYFPELNPEKNYFTRTYVRNLESESSTTTDLLDDTTDTSNMYVVSAEKFKAAYDDVKGKFGCQQDSNLCNQKGGYCNVEGLCLCNLYYYGDDCSKKIDELTIYKGEVTEGDIAGAVCGWLFGTIILYIIGLVVIEYCHS